MHSCCQKKIVNQIVEQKADYLIALKKNQPGLYERVNKLFQSVLFQDKVDLNLSSHTVFKSSHGRTEARYYHVLNNVSEIVDKEQKWSELNSIVRVEYLRKLKKGKIKLKNRYYITSLSKNAEELAEYVLSTHALFFLLIHRKVRHIKHFLKLNADIKSDLRFENS